jgi:hypothetical protein
MYHIKRNKYKKKGNVAIGWGNGVSASFPEEANHEIALGRIGTGRSLCTNPNEVRE